MLGAGSFYHFYQSKEELTIAAVERAPPRSPGMRPPVLPVRRSRSTSSPEGGRRSRTHRVGARLAPNYSSMVSRGRHPGEALNVDRGVLQGVHEPEGLSVAEESLHADDIGSPGNLGDTYEVAAVVFGPEAPDPRWWPHRTRPGATATSSTARAAVPPARAHGSSVKDTAISPTWSASPNSVAVAATEGAHLGGCLVRRAQGAPRHEKP